MARSKRRTGARSNPRPPQPGNPRAAASRVPAPSPIAEPPANQMQALLGQEVPDVPTVEDLLGPDSPAPAEGEPGDVPAFEEPLDIADVVASLRQRSQELALALAKAQGWIDIGRGVRELRDNFEERNARLTTREEDLNAREEDAKEGFSDLLEQQRMKVARECAEEADRRSAEDQAKVHEQLIALRTERTAVAAEQIALLEAQGTLAKDHQRLQKKQHDLDAASLQNEYDVALERLRAQTDIAGKVQALEAQLLESQERHEAALESLDSLRPQLQRAEMMKLHLGGRQPAELLAELSEMAARVAALENETGGALSAQERRQLSQREKELAQEREKVADLIVEVANLNARLVVADVQGLELAAHRSSTQSLRSITDGYQRVVEELEGKWKSLQSAAASVPFPSCTAMDSDPRLLRSPSAADRNGIKLPDLGRRLPGLLRKALGTELHYDPVDLQLLLGGLAMSRLHILEGESGTGKTSLAQALAAALGWGHAVVDVQAGWRDKQDLLGYFNTFERRFEETDFFRALYEAQTPAYRDLPYLVVLDEANLSHPEQYFAEFLSKMEQHDPKPFVVAPHALPDAPEHLKPGNLLKIPKNVWFVATANHDETTKGFAPKTVDRSHVQSLRRGKPSPVEKPRSAPLALKTLETAFTAAQAEGLEDANECLDQLDRHLPRLLSPLSLSYAERFREHARRFLPVVQAASGGSAAVGLDHLLATKVFYRLEGRFDLRRQPLAELRDGLALLWTDVDKASLPDRSLEIIERAHTKAT